MPIFGREKYYSTLVIAIPDRSLPPTRALSALTFTETCSFRLGFLLRRESFILFVNADFCVLFELMEEESYDDFTWSCGTESCEKITVMEILQNQPDNELDLIDDVDLIEMDEIDPITNQPYYLPLGNSIYRSVLKIFHCV